MIRTLLTLAALSVGVVAAQSAQLDALKVQTQFKNIALSDLRSGGPPPNGIPPLGFAGDSGPLPDTSAVKFESVKEAAGWLTPREPVILVTVGGRSGIFPMQVLLWHEIANVTLGNVPLAVTFCPLCNTALVADRRIPIGPEQRTRLKGTPQANASSVLVTFGVSGLLYKSDLVMFDSVTHSLWYQAIGRGLVGPLEGAELRVYPSLIVPFEEAAWAAPRALVLSKETGYDRPYGRNPYVGYDNAAEPPFLYDGPVDGRLPPKERVVTVTAGDARAAYPFTLLSKLGVVNDRVGDVPLTVFWASGTTSALGSAALRDGRDVGAGVVFDRRVGGRTLTFGRVDGSFRDRETGSTWTLTGQATAGALKGQTLKPVVHANHFWFAWAAYAPQTRIYTAR
ncbi:DUF3179 domain-containing protein [Deinococcus frigens]|uniref:DUF3179 domain-containing protein n=1 Tax=Deinococcus frigens TaxID=249403 RepID=UPI0004970F31|nr:DUF3179 domain-containing protein [Deinococcus frigens]